MPMHQLAIAAPHHSNEPPCTGLIRVSLPLQLQQRTIVLPVLLEPMLQLQVITCMLTREPVR
jgi:hypothetical protein